MDSKTTAWCRAGSGAARRRPSRHGRTFSKISIIAGFGCFSGGFCGLSKSGPDQDAIRIGSGLDQDRVRNSPFGGLFRGPPACRQETSRQKPFVILYFTFLICCVLSAGPGRSGAASTGETAARYRANGVFVLSVDNISPYILFDRCAMRIFKILLSHPCRGRFRSHLKRRQPPMRKGLRRRFRTPEKLFSGELSNWAYLALFKTAAPAKRPLFQGANVTQEGG